MRLVRLFVSGNEISSVNTAHPVNNTKLWYPGRSSLVKHQGSDETNEKERHTCIKMKLECSYVLQPSGKRRLMSVWHVFESSTRLCAVLLPPIILIPFHVLKYSYVANTLAPNGGSGKVFANHSWLQTSSRSRGFEYPGGFIHVPVCFGSRLFGSRLARSHDPCLQRYLLQEKPSASVWKALNGACDISSCGTKHYHWTCSYVQDLDS